MALSIIGSNLQQLTSIAIPTHQIGDLIIIWAWRDGSTAAPTKPTAGGTVPAWNDIDVSSGGGNSCSQRSAYFVATATTTTSGTWVNADTLFVAVLRGQDAVTPIGGHGILTGSNSTHATAPAVTLSVADGTSVLYYCYGHRNVTAWDAAPSGYTRAHTINSESCVNTKDVTTSSVQESQTGTMSASGGYRGQTIEIVAQAAATGNPWYAYAQQ